MEIQDIYLDAIGIYLPEIVSTASAVAEGLCRPEVEQEWGLTGLAASDGVSGPDMAVLAAEAALERATVDRSEIDALFHSSCFHNGPDAWCAQNYIQAKTLSRNVPSFEVRNGCNGFFSAVELAACYLRANPRAETVLVTMGDNMDSPMVDRWSSAPFQLIGDAGAAAILTKRSGFARFRSVAGILVQELEGLHRGGDPLFPPPATTGRPLDIGARTMNFLRDTPVAEFAKYSAEGLARLVDVLLAESALDVDDFAKVSYMSASGELTEQRLMTPLGLPMERSAWEFARTVGHLASADHLAALDHLLGTGELVAGEHMLMVGLASGLSVCGATVEVLGQPQWLG